MNISIADIHENAYNNNLSKLDKKLKLIALVSTFYFFCQIKKNCETIRKNSRINLWVTGIVSYPKFLQMMKLKRIKSLHMDFCDNFFARCVSRARATRPFLQEFSDILPSLNLEFRERIYSEFKLTGLKRSKTSWHRL